MTKKKRSPNNTESNIISLKGWYRTKKSGSEKLLTEGEKLWDEMDFRTERIVQELDTLNKRIDKVENLLLRTLRAIKNNIKN